MTRTVDFAEKRRVLQLETLYDLALTLHVDRSESELVEEVLHLVCAVLDPAVAVAVTRDEIGQARAVASVGWRGMSPAGRALLDDALWRQLLAEGHSISRHDGELCGRSYRELVAAPIAYRGVFLGYLALLDKESRESAEPGFSAEDQRFLDSVASLAGVTLDSVRQFADLETQRQRLAEENKVLKGRLVDEFAEHRIVAQAPAMRQVLDIVGRVAPRNVNILLRGESGTGKELFAKLLHSQSRRSGPLIAINCAAMPESLLESELFGIEGGVATGVQARRGKFELADGGTLFLDEIGDMQLPLQVKLLRALQEREVTHVGGREPVPIDVRIIAATHRNLESTVANGQFREDLYYRLKGVDIELPALRDRRQDIPHLIRHFLEEFCHREGIDIPVIESEALAMLLTYDFPGNVRELQNLVEGAVSLSDRSVDLEILLSMLGVGSEAASQPMALETIEKRHIERILRLTAGNKSAAAKILGVDRRTLQRKGF